MVSWKKEGSVLRTSQSFLSFSKSLCAANCLLRMTNLFDKNSGRRLFPDSFFGDCAILVWFFYFVIIAQFYIENQLVSEILCSNSCAFPALCCAFFAHCNFIILNFVVIIFKFRNKNSYYYWQFQINCKIYFYLMWSYVWGLGLEFSLMEPQGVAMC